MHELAVTENILKIALDEAKRYNADKVTEIRITMGELTTFIPECVQEYFNLLSEDTPAYMAKLVFKTEPAILRCRDCGSEFRMEYRRLKCIKCDSMNVEIISGKDFFVESLDIETNEE